MFHPQAFLNSWLLAFLILPIAVISQNELRGLPNIQAELGPQLSPGASIILPQDSGFPGETYRWSNWSLPTFRAAIQVASEQDVQNTIKWANKYNIPFIAVGGHHGVNSHLGDLKNGIEISFSKMKQIQLSDDGRSVTVGPGLKSGELLRGLFALGKRTPTGSCLCTGITGLLLGGGHGYLQGQHGLMIDNLLEARMVLADGSAVTVSKRSNGDLFWAIRGAGHNFGVLTSITLKVYDQPQRDWSYVQIIYPGTMTEKIFEASNEFNKNVPPEMTNFIIMRRIPQLPFSNDTLILSNFYYDGPLSALLTCIAPFTAIESFSIINTTGSYLDMLSKAGDDENAPQCIDGNSNQFFSANMDEYNSAAQRHIYNTWNEATKNPGLALGTIIYESYGRQAVLAVPDENTAVPWRKYKLAVSPQPQFSDPSLADTAAALGKSIRSALVAQTGGNPLSVYVNYAFGDESLEAMYGYDSWRVPKLQDLKRKYDPQGKFNFYSPITTGQY